MNTAVLAKLLEEACPGTMDREINRDTSRGIIAFVRGGWHLFTIEDDGVGVQTFSPDGLLLCDWFEEHDFIDWAANLNATYRGN